MIPAKQDWHEGWRISTACWEENPEGWKSGDPVQYCASGIAELVYRNAHSGAWLSTAKIIAPADKAGLFNDFHTAHQTIAESLRSMIDALKVP